MNNNIFKTQLFSHRYNACIQNDEVTAQLRIKQTSCLAASLLSRHNTSPAAPVSAIKVNSFTAIVGLCAVNSTALIKDLPYMT